MIASTTRTRRSSGWRRGFRRRCSGRSVCSSDMRRAETRPKRWRRSARRRRRRRAGICMGLLGVGHRLRPDWRTGLGDRLADQCDSPWVDQLSVSLAARPAPEKPSPGEAVHRRDGAGARPMGAARSVGQVESWPSAHYSRNSVELIRRPPNGFANFRQHGTGDATTSTTPRSIDARIGHERRVRFD